MTCLQIALKWTKTHRKEPIFYKELTKEECRKSNKPLTKMENFYVHHRRLQGTRGATAWVDDRISVDNQIYLKLNLDLLAVTQYK